MKMLNKPSAQYMELVLLTVLTLLLILSAVIHLGGNQSFVRFVVFRTLIFDVGLLIRVLPMTLSLKRMCLIWY